MGLFGKKQEQEEQTPLYKVYAPKPIDPHNERVVYTIDKEEAERQAELLRQREKQVKVKKV